MSLAAVTAAGEGALTAPAAIRGGTRSGSRFQTVTGQPCSSRRKLIAVPMMPRPMKPIRAFSTAMLVSDSNV